MPRFVVPKKSGVHRIASIALFRALLTSCKVAPLAEEERRTGQNVIRNQFKRNQEVHSKRLLTTAFQAGYEALDHLEASRAGNPASISFIKDLLQHTPGYLKRTPATGFTTPTPKKTPPVYQRRPEDSILARPRASVTGKRKVPTLVIANSIPFLRFKKPQPASLSGYIRSRVKQRQERHNRRDWLASVVVLATAEDQWDRLMERNFEIDTESPALKITWATEYRADIIRVSDALVEESRKSREMFLRLSEIVEGEKKLAAAEEVERKAKRMKEKGKEKKLRQRSIHSTPA